MKVWFVLLILSLSSALEIEENETLGMFDFPPSSTADLESVSSSFLIPVWRSAVDSYGPVGAAAKREAIHGSLLQEAQVDLEENNSDAFSSDDNETVEAHNEEEEEEEAPASDLLDVDVETLLSDGASENEELDLSKRKTLPSVLQTDPRIARLREAMHALRQKLGPLHKRICRKSFASCLAIRKRNAKMLRNLVRRGCHVRAKGCSVRRALSSRRRGPSSSSRSSSSRPRRVSRLLGKGCKLNEFGDSECAAGDEQKLRRVSRVYTYLQHVYSRLYVRYALLVARYYRRKFKTLTVVFMNTVKQLKWEAKKVHLETEKLQVRLNQLRADSRKMRDRTAKQHDEHKKKMDAESKQQQAEKAKIEKDAGDVNAELMLEQGKRMRLQQELDDLNSKIRKEDANKKKAEADKAKVAEESKNLAADNQKLLDRIGTLQAQLDDSRTRITNLGKLKDALNAQLLATREILSRFNAEKDAADRARERIQTAYNQLQTQLNALLSSHKSDADRQQAAIADLKAQIALQSKRCVPDACGVCNGDESTCAYLRQGHTCYSVGDPHLRTFDGIAYDYQHDGQFLYMWHGNPVNVEVQTTQSPVCGGCWPRLNRGVAVRGGRDVVVAYPSWGSGAVQVNGNRVALPMGQWQRVGPGYSVLRQDGSTVQFRYTARGQVVSVIAKLWGHYTDIYINAPWQWSSGRSVFGLCGDFNGWSGDDSLIIGRNHVRMFTVTNQRRDMFRFPQRRTTDLELNDHTPQELLDEWHWDEVNGVRHPEHMQPYEGEDLELVENILNGPAPATAAGGKNVTVSATQAALNNAGKKASPGAKADFGPATPEMTKTARDKCRGSHGEVRKQCMVDLLWGQRANDTRAHFQAANLLGKETLLKRCMVMDKHHFAMFAASSLPPIETAKEGVSLAFWWNPDTLPAKRCILLEKGRDFFVTQDGSDLSVGIGPLSCTATNVLTNGNWTAVTVVVHHVRGLQLFVNDQPACASPATKNVFSAEDKRDDLLAGGADSKDTCSGRMAHLYYIPQTVTRKEVSAHGQMHPFACQRPRNDTRTAF